jgi:enoyl-CoA hydratase/carnithine racemase
MTLEVHVVDDRVWEFVLARPDVLNALDATLRDELWSALGAAHAAGVAVALRGAGRAFCAGGDLDEFGTERDGGRAHVTRQLHGLAWRCAAIADRLVVGVHGACYGAGLELAAVAARLVCDETARFCLPELELGLIPGAGGTVSIPRRIGRQRTLELCLSGRVVEPGEAREIGLVDEIVAGGQLVSRMRACASELAP